MQFHDGLPLTAEAVRLWIERGKTLEASTIKGDLAAVGSVEETDTMTAAFRMDRPFSPLLWILGDRAGLILSPNSFDDFTELNNRNTPVGTGAHVFVEESLDGPFVMDANPNYWKPNAPHIEGVTFNAGEDATFGATNALLAGDYDAIRFPAEEDHDRIRDAGYELIIQPSNTTGFYNMNHEHRALEQSARPPCVQRRLRSHRTERHGSSAATTRRRCGAGMVRRSSITTRTSASGSSTRRSCKCTLPPAASRTASSST